MGETVAGVFEKKECCGRCCLSRSLLSKSQPDTHSAHQGASDSVQQTDVAFFAEEAAECLATACVNNHAEEFNGEDNCE